MSSELPAPSTATLRRQLGKGGLFRLGVPRSLGGHGGTKEDVVRAVAAVAKRHPKSGVLLASQRERPTAWSLPRGGRLEGAVEHTGAPSRMGLGGAVRYAAV